MKAFRLTLALTLALASLISCKSQYDLLLEGHDVDAKYAAAFDYFNNGKYQKAAAMFESLAYITSGMSIDDTVQYYWGLSNYRFKDYVTAESNLERFVTNYPRSPFAEDANFLRIDCMFRSTLRYELDQTPTYKAMAQISTFMGDYPKSDKIEVCLKMLEDLGARLDRKEYENARLYYKMEDYKAARVALNNVLKDDAENIYREDILYHIAMSSYKYADMSVQQKKKERFLQFVDDYLNFVGEYPESHYRTELDALYRKVKDK
ncbi:MAG: outer membrane protein assembly factor BamD [Bacteroidales bacterium]|nr:outer membrane protein assembly factor BamD [Bacteroidales bacterium]